MHGYDRQVRAEETGVWACEGRLINQTNSKIERWKGFLPSVQRTFFYGQKKISDSTRLLVFLDCPVNMLFSRIIVPSASQTTGTCWISVLNTTEYAGGTRSPDCLS